MKSPKITTATPAHAERRARPARATATDLKAEGARDEAAAIVLLAKARMGELTREIPKVAPGPAAVVFRPGTQPKRETLEDFDRDEPREERKQRGKSAVLEAQGVSRKEAAECEKIADLKASGDLDRIAAAHAPRMGAA